MTAKQKSIKCEDKPVRKISDLQYKTVMGLGKCTKQPDLNAVAILPDGVTKLYSVCEHEFNFKSQEQENRSGGDE